MGHCKVTSSFGVQISTTALVFPHSVVYRIAASKKFKKMLNKYLLQSLIVSNTQEMLSKTLLRTTCYKRLLEDFLKTHTTAI